MANWIEIPLMYFGMRARAWEVGRCLGYWFVTLRSVWYLIAKRVLPHQITIY